jgi:hypothetical protein
MDFFDPQKQKRHSIRLSIGYALMGVVLVLATTILLHQAYGFGLDKDGRVIQNGLVFVSSRPEGADAYVNGQKYKDRTNTRMNLPAGQYVLELKRQGYRDWKRVLTVEGGSVERFDYPFLFPADLQASAVKQYASAIGFGTVSLDRRWMLVGGGQNTFDLFDLDEREPAVTTLEVPVEIVAAGSTTTGWQLVEWSKDNRHVLLRRLYDRFGQAGAEYILFDRESPALSRNMSVAFGFSPTSIELRDQAYDRYYLFDQNSAQVFTATLDQPTPQPLISGALAFTSEKDIVAYATAQDAPAGKVWFKVKDGDDEARNLRQAPAGSAYLLEMAEYEDDTYLAVGAAVENRAFLYRDPVGGLKETPDQPLAPVQILKAESPLHVSFSANKRFVIIQNGAKFSVYDAEEDRGYTYQVAAAPDIPTTRATWMDGFRLSYVSGGKTVVFDFDGTNLQSLTEAVASHVPVFDRDYRYLYTFTSQNALTRTALLIEEDL